MKQILKVALALGMGLLGVGTAAADVSVVSTGGTFMAGTPTTSWSGAGDKWKLSFMVDDTPTISSSVAGQWFDIPFTDFMYTLNGSVVNVAPVDIAFFNQSIGGFFNICFFGCVASGNVTEGFVEYGPTNVGPQLYKDPESAPAIQPGSYAESASTAFVSSFGYGQPAGIVTITPEPGYLLILTGALTGLWLLKNKRTARRDPTVQSS